MSLKNIIIGILCTVSLFTSGFMLTLWYLDPGYTFTAPSSQVVNQVEGTSVAVSLPLYEYEYVAGIDDLSIYTEIMGTDGIVLQRTPSVTPYPNEHYKVITDSRLPVGTFYIVLCVVYKSNPIKWQTAQIPLGILHVINKD